MSSLAVCAHVPSKSIAIGGARGSRWVLTKLQRRKQARAVLCEHVRCFASTRSLKPLQVPKVRKSRLMYRRYTNLLAGVRFLHMRAGEMLRVPSRSTANMHVARSLRPCPDLHPFRALLEKAEIP